MHTHSGVGDVCCFNGISFFVMKLNNKNKNIQNRNKKMGGRYRLQNNAKTTSS